MELPSVDLMMQPLGDDEVGENLEYDPQYLRMDELAVAVPDMEIGDSVSEGRDPDYRELAKVTIGLWDKTRDLRVGSYFTLAAMCLNGLSGLKQGLQVVAYLCDDLWDKCYPQLDPDDDNDPTERINILSMFSPKSGSYNDPIDFVGQFRKHRICDDLPFSLRDIQIAQGIIQNAETKADLNQIQGQFSALGGAKLELILSQLQDIKDIIAHIIETVNDKIGSQGNIQFDLLNREIGILDKFLSPLIVEEDSNIQGGNVVDLVVPSTSGIGAGSVNANVATRTVAVTDVNSLIVANRQDALALIKKCADYFRRSEPSSPLPFLLDRVIKMSDMNFIEILTEIDRNTLDKVREQLGVHDESQDY